jgi:hypothetical protein
MRYEPLKRWKNETVIYGRRDSGRTVVPVIKAIIRLPDEPGKPLSKKGRSTYKRRMKSTASEIDHNPELGWDDNTESMGIVRDMETGETVEKSNFLGQKSQPYFSRDIRDRIHCSDGSSTSCCQQRFLLSEDIWRR